MAVQISAYFSSISWDARKPYLQKLRIGGIGLPDPFGIDEGLWSEDARAYAGGGGGVDGFERPPPLSPMRGHLHHWNFFFHIAY